MPCEEIKRPCTVIPETREECKTTIDRIRWMLAKVAEHSEKHLKQFDRIQHLSFNQRKAKQRVAAGREATLGLMGCTDEEIMQTISENEVEAMYDEWKSLADPNLTDDLSTRKTKRR